MIASLCGWRRRGAPDDRSLGCVLRPKGLATVWGAQRAPGPTNTRARGTKNEPTSGPAPLSTIDPFHPARVRLRPVGNLYHLDDARTTPGSARPEAADEHRTCSPETQGFLHIEAPPHAAAALLRRGIGTRFHD